MFAYINEILELSKSNKMDNNAETICKLLSTLAGKLRVHLAIEDKSLYLRFLEHKNSDVKMIAKHCQSGRSSSVVRFIYC